MWLYRGDDGKVQEVLDQFIETPGEEIRTKIKLRKVIEKYKAEKFPSPWDEILGIEEELYFHAGEFKFVVIPDMVVRWRGAVYGIEHKHTTRFVDNFFVKFRRDSQIDAQMLGIREKYGSCNGIYINGIVVRKGGPTSKLADVEFMRDIAERTERELERSRDYFREWAHKATVDETKEENRRACYDYNSTCEYLGICTDRLSSEEVEEKFEVKPWEPRKEKVIDEG